MEENLIEPHRVFLQEGDVFRVNENNTLRKAKLFLFNDITLIGMQPMDLSPLTKSEVIYFYDHRIIGLFDAAIESDSGTDNRFTITTTGDKKETKRYTIQMPVSHTKDRDKWVTNIRSTIEAMKKVSNPSRLSTGLTTRRLFQGRAAWLAVLMGMGCLLMALPYIVIVVLGVELHRRYINLEYEKEIIVVMAFIALFSSVVGLSFLSQQQKKKQQ